MSAGKPLVWCGQLQWADMGSLEDASGHPEGVWRTPLLLEKARQYQREPSLAITWLLSPWRGELCVDFLSLCSWTSTPSHGRIEMSVY